MGFILIGLLDLITMMIRTHYALLLVTGILPMFCGATALGQETAHWSQFRGSDGRAVAASTNVPIPFDLKKDLAWKIEVPTGHSSPVVWGDQVFLSGYQDETLLMLCYSRKDGKELWRHEVEARGEELAEHTSCCPAMPTPCTDGKLVYFYFGAYGVCALTVSGEVAWEKKLPVPRHQFGTGNSPILAGDAVVLVRDGARERAILGLSRKNGEQLWKIPRMAFIVTYATPFLWKNSQREELVIAGTGRLASFDPKNGKKLWQVGDTAIFVCPTPTADKNRIYYAAWTTGNTHGVPMIDSLFGEGKYSKAELANSKVFFRVLDTNGDGKVLPDELHECRAKDCFEYADRNKNGAWEVREVAGLLRGSSGPGRNICIAVQAGGDGVITKSHVEWEYKRGLPYVSSPLLHQGRLYMYKSGGLVTCLDPKTGKAHYRQKRLTDFSEAYASPVGVGGHVLICTSGGTCHFLKASNKLEVEAVVDFGEKIHATPAVLRDQILVRSARHLWAFEK
jgi:outer membrane protein assembly factor BamB